MELSCRLKSVVAAGAISLCLWSPVHAEDLGAIGETYSIRERDALSEIQERASRVNWSKLINKKKIDSLSKKAALRKGVYLPPAQEDRVFRPDMDYTLKMDITDAQGQVLYPKGYTFNPLSYVQLPYRIVVIDGQDKAQVAWLKRVFKESSGAWMTLTTQGDPRNLSKKLSGRPAYVADKKIVKRFQLKAVPSVITQKGTTLEVREYAILDKNNSR